MISEDKSKTRVLILGAGLVTRPIVRNLLDEAGYTVTVADCEIQKARNLVQGHRHGRAVSLNVEDTSALREAIADNDLVVSLVPFTFHSSIASCCIDLRKPMVTTSYISPEMKKLDGKAREASILILNEIGVDPGIDHMSAMRIIHDVEARGGKVISYYSYCGGLPAPEANDNPFGYKFSWSPRGVVLAGRNDGRYLKDGKVVEIPNTVYFSHHWDVEIEGLGNLEAYPNRTALPYIELYGLEGITSIYRGTLRNRGWCDTWNVFVNIGLLDLEVRTDLEGLTFREFMGRILVCDPADVKAKLAEKAAIDPDSEIIGRMEWLGLFTDDPIPPENTYLDVLSDQLCRKLQYKENERDMIILLHDFRAKFPDRKTETKITSTLIEYGIPGGDTAMARTVSLPAAIACRLILEGRITETGVHIPVSPSIYNPVMDELEGQGIVFKEKEEG